MTVQTTTTPRTGPATASRGSLAALDGGPRAAARPSPPVPRSGRYENVPGRVRRSRLARYATDAARHDLVHLFEYARLGRSAVRCEQVGLAEVAWDSAAGAGSTYFPRLPLAEARGPSHR
jgi:hypothetical protein